MKEKILILAPISYQKDYLLHNHTFNMIKFMTKEEFISNYFGKVSNESIYYLMKEKKYKYEVAKEYLDNFLFHEDTLRFLQEHHLIEYNPYFKELLKAYDIKVFYTDLDKYLKDVLSNYSCTYINKKRGNNKPQVYELSNSILEIAFVCEDIISKKIPLEKTYLVNIDDSYNLLLPLIFKMYHLPINYPNEDNIYSYIETKLFINKLKETKDIMSSLDVITNVDLKNIIIDIINDYTLDIDDIYINIIINRLQNTSFKKATYKNAINVININDIEDIDGYYYMMNFANGIIPKTYHDDDLLKDEEKIKCGINTSLDKLNIEKNNLIYLLNTLNNLVITYKQNDFYNNYSISSIITDLELEINKPSLTYLYSNSFNRLSLAKLLDDYRNYNTTSDELFTLLSTYPDYKYNSYNNKYTLINNFKEDLSLSYSSLNDYVHCPFKYYLKYILKLNIIKDDYYLYLGNLFHNALEKIYDNFDIYKEYNKYLQERNLTPKEEYYYHKLYTNLEEFIKYLKEQESLSSFKERHVEKKIDFTLNNIYINGKIDKIEIKDNYLYIVDYKTGSNYNAKLDNINDGLNLQLPFYLYLIKHSSFKDKQLVGLYFQSVLNKENKYYLDGYSIDDQDILEEINSLYKNGTYLKGVSLNKDGNLKDGRILTKDNFDMIYSTVDDVINKKIMEIKKAHFNIQPKRCNGNDISCKDCPFNNICYHKEEDYQDINVVKLEDALGGYNGF